MRIQRDKLIIVLILVAGFIIRLAGLKHGLPGIYHPDEPIVVSRAVNIVVNGDWNPHFFHWPSLLIYILAVEYYIIWFILNLSGQIGNLREFQAYYILNRDVFHFWGRILIAIMGTGSAFFIYQTVRIWLDKQAALIILVTALITPLLVKHSLYITPDVAGFYVSTVIIFMMAQYLFNGKSLKSLLGPALLVGVAAAYKYNFSLMLVPILFLIFTAKDSKITGRIAYGLTACALALAVFLILNPYIILDFSTFKSQFNEISIHLKEGHIGMEAGNPAIDLIKHTISGTGPVLLILSIIGFFMSLKQNWRWSAALVIFPLIILISHTRWPVTADRYAIPILIFILYFSAFSIKALLDTKPVFRPFTIVLIAVMILQPVVASGRIIVNHSKKDTREVTRQWMRDNIPSGSKLALEKDGPDLKSQNALGEYYNEPAYYYLTITPWYGTHFRTQDTPLDQIIKNKPEYVIINSGVYSRYEPGAPSATQFPEIYAVWRDYYNKLEQIGELVYEVHPSKNLVGPAVKIYKIPGAIYDQVVAIPPDQAGNN